MAGKIDSLKRAFLVLSVLSVYEGSGASPTERKTGEPLSPRQSRSLAFRPAKIHRPVNSSVRQFIGPSIHYSATSVNDIGREIK